MPRRSRRSAPPRRPKPPPPSSGSQRRLRRPPRARAALHARTLSPREQRALDALEDALDVLARYDRQPAIHREGPARKVEGMWEALGACERVIWRVARLGLHERPALRQHPAILALKGWVRMRQGLGMWDWFRRARGGLKRGEQQHPFSSEQLKISLAITETLPDRRDYGTRRSDSRHEA
jgi:hypothetical protein